MTGKSIGRQAEDQLRRMYQRTAHLKPGQTTDTRKEKVRVNRRQGLLMGDLDAPEAVLDADPTVARFEFLTEGADGQLHRTGVFNVITNHDPSVTASEGDYVIVQRTDGLWMLNSGVGGIYIELLEDLGEPKSGLEADPPQAEAAVLEFDDDGKLQIGEKRMLVKNRGRGMFYEQGTRGYPMTLLGERHFIPIECDPGESSSSDSMESFTASVGLP